MVKVSKFFKCLIISLLIVSANVKHANAFFLLPPMPWDFELNIPGNANKIISNLKSYYRQLQALKTAIKNGNLSAIKLGALNLGAALGSHLGQFLPKTEKKGGNKTPGKGGALKDTDLGIDENSLDETQYSDAYHKLFFQFPEVEGDSAYNAVIKSAFEQKKIDYQQDVIIETYMAGVNNEEFLKLVEKTLLRLEKCSTGIQNGNSDTSECVFFGMEMVYSEPEAETPPEQEGEQGGAVGESMNGYIVTTLYDRLLRIVEDLTAIEAIYRAAKQIELVEPMTTSSADKYLDNKFKFAYKSITEHDNAKIDLKSALKGKVLNVTKKRSDFCKGGSSILCPKENSTTLDQSSIDNTEILRNLQPIDDLITQTMQLHNLKSELPEYKTQYRKYLKSIEVHERAVNVLAQSDECVIDFIARHSDNKNRFLASQKWYGTKPGKASDHENRWGISRELIKEYQKYTTDTLIGTDSDECSGYYEKGGCPSGYISDEKNPCKENKDMFPCIVETITQDTERDDFTPTIESDYHNIGSSDGDDYDATDGFMDGSQADTIDTENRKKAERNWRIGANKVLEMTKSGELKFDQWNDQQNIQEEYLENKYRNIRMIIRSMDKALSSYKVAHKLAGNDSLNESEEPIARLITKITAVKTPEEAVNDGTALSYAKSQGLCDTYNSLEGSAYTKTVSTRWEETKTRQKRDKEGRLVYDKKGSVVTEPYKVEHTDGTIKLKCYVKASNTTGFIDVVKEEYKDGTQSTKNEKVSKKAIDLRVKNDINSYPSPFTKETKSIESMISNNEGKTNNTCPSTWNYTVNGIVKEFVPTVIGQCAKGIDNQTKKLFDTAQKEGRIVATDKLQSVKDERTKQEANIQKFIRDYHNKITSLKKKRANTIASRTSWTKNISTLTDEKNEYVEQREQSKQRLTEIANQKAEFERRKGVNKTKINRLFRRLLEKQRDNKIKKEEELLDNEIKMLEIEKTCIEKAKSGYCYICMKLDTSKTKCAQENKENKSISLNEANTQIDIRNKTIEQYNNYLDNSKDAVKRIDEELRSESETFADKYIDLAEEAQDAIEEANAGFEKFVTSDGTRMMGPKKCSGWGPFRSCSQYKGDDGLAVTIKEFLSGGENVKNYAKENIEKIWFSTASIADMAKNMGSIGLPSAINIAEDVDLGMDVVLKAGTYSNLTEVINKIKNQIINQAAEKVKNYINQADEIVTTEMEDAVEEVNTWAGGTLCLDGEGDNQTSGSCSNGFNIDKKYNYMVYENYLSKEKVDEELAAMAESLQNIKTQPVKVAYRTSGSAIMGYINGTTVKSFNENNVVGYVNGNNIVDIYGTAKGFNGGSIGKVDTNGKLLDTNNKSIGNVGAKRKLAYNKQGSSIIGYVDQYNRVINAAGNQIATVSGKNIYDANNKQIGKTGAQKKIIFGTDGKALGYQDKENTDIVIGRVGDIKDIVYIDGKAIGFVDGNNEVKNFSGAKTGRVTLNKDNELCLFKDSDIKNENGDITRGHMKLIEDLSMPTINNISLLIESGIDLRKLFGIPSMSTISTDTEYFVALPARGLVAEITKVNGQDVEDASIRCKYNNKVSEYNDGCDYMAPREPLATIPPLREVFYFSSLDYDEVPKSGKGPAISTLLDYKYADEVFEYLPEVWRYLLARPNLRNDGKYQQTFTERGYGQNTLKEYLEEFDNKKSRLVLSRGGVFPCKTGGYIIDINADDNIKNVNYSKRKGSLPAGVPANAECRDVNMFKGKYVQNMLADFEPKKKDNKNPALQTSVKSTKDANLYTNYSELSQFLQPKKKQFKYRALAESAFKYLLDKKNQKNDILRQKAEEVSFKRNIMGGFLENVNAEHNAKKGMDNSLQDVKDTLASLCEQIHNFGEYVGNEKDLEGDEKTESCVTHIMKNGGLASSADDDDYEPKATTGSYYNSLFSKLDGWKAQKLAEVERQFESVKKRFSKAELDSVEERILEIETFIGAFKADTNELVSIQPGDTKDTIKEALKTAKADRKAARAADDEAITSMDNQSRSVAYCPIY